MPSNCIIANPLSFAYFRVYQWYWLVFSVQNYENAFFSITLFMFQNFLISRSGVSSYFCSINHNLKQNNSSKNNCGFFVHKWRSMTSPNQVFSKKSGNYNLELAVDFLSTNDAPWRSQTHVDFLSTNVAPSYTQGFW